MSKPQTRAGQAHPVAHPVLLSIDELAVACSIETTWVVERVQAGLIDPPADAPVEAEPAQWRFGDEHLVRVRCMVAMERDMDANPELAALVADLIDEVQRLRRIVRSRPA